MSWFKSKSHMVEPEQALPGRSTAMAVPGRHLVLGTPLQGASADGLERAIFAMGCFWGAERKFWVEQGVYTTAVGYSGGYTPNPTYEEVCSGRTGHAEAVLVVFDPTKISYEKLLSIFWESHDPTQGMRQGNDAGTQYRSAIYTTSPAQQAAAERSRVCLPVGTRCRRARTDHDRDRTRRALLLRGGLPPAVPREEPQRLLRPRWHRRRLPGGPGRRRRVGGAAGRCSVRLFVGSRRFRRRGTGSSLKLRSGFDEDFTRRRCQLFRRRVRRGE